MKEFMFEIQKASAFAEEVEKLLKETKESPVLVCHSLNEEEVVREKQHVVVEIPIPPPIQAIVTAHENLKRGLDSDTAYHPLRPEIKRELEIQRDVLYLVLLNWVEETVLKDQTLCMVFAQIELDPKVGKNWRMLFIQKNDPHKEDSKK